MLVAVLDEGQLGSLASAVFCRASKISCVDEHRSQDLGRGYLYPAPNMDPEYPSELKREAFASPPRGKLQKKQSMAYVPGREGKFIGRGTDTGKAIGVFTSGGDAQGL